MLNLMPKKMGVLTSTDIKKCGIIDTDFSEESLKCASYDFRLGNEYICPADSTEMKACNGIIRPYVKKEKREKWTKYACPLEENSVIKDTKDTNNVLTIKRFSSVVISSLESVNVPENVVGRFDLRIKYALQGLVLQVGPQIEPGSKGKLFGLLLNFSNKDITLRYGERILTAEFSYLSETIENKNVKFCKNLTEFVSEHACVHNYGTLESYLTEIASHKEDVREMKNEIERNRERKLRYLLTFTNVIFPLLFALCIPFITLQITKSTLDKGDYPFAEILRQEQKNDSLREEVQFLKKEIDKLRDIQRKKETEVGLSNK